MYINSFYGGDRMREFYCILLIFIFSIETLADSKSWEGIHFGTHTNIMNISGTYTGVEETDDIGAHSFTDLTINLGLRLGYTWGIGKSSIFGVEVDSNQFGESAQSRTPGVDDTTYEHSLKWNSWHSFRIRSGFSFDKSILFLTLGGAFVDRDHKFHGISGSNSGENDYLINEKSDGLTYGIGSEIKVSNSFSVRFEFQRITLPSTKSRAIWDDDGERDTEFSSSADLISLGLSYQS